MLTTQTVAYLEVPTSEVSVVVLLYRYQLWLFYVLKLYVENWARLKKRQDYPKLARCGNFTTFLSLRFYVKSSLENLEV